MNRGLLAVGFDFANAHADEFHDWYDLEHIPEREAVPGFGACERGGQGGQDVARRRRVRLNRRQATTTWVLALRDGENPAMAHGAGREEDFM